MEVPTRVGAVWGAGSEPRIPLLMAGVKTKAANELVKQFFGVVVVALFESTEPVAAEGMRNVIVFHGVTISARPGIANEGDHSDAHPCVSSVLKSLVAQADGRGLVDSVKPLAAGVRARALRGGAWALSVGQKRSSSAHLLAVRVWRT
jgi:hypothetical protein